MYYSRFLVEKFHDLCHLGLRDLAIHVHEEVVQVPEQLEVDSGGSTLGVGRYDLTCHTKSFRDILMKNRHVKGVPRLLIRCMSPPLAVSRRVAVVELACYVCSYVCMYSYPAAK